MLVVFKQAPTACFDGFVLPVCGAERIFHTVVMFPLLLYYKWGLGINKALQQSIFDMPLLFRAKCPFVAIELGRTGSFVAQNKTKDTTATKGCITGVGALCGVGAPEAFMPNKPFCLPAHYIYQTCNLCSVFSLKKSHIPAVRNRTPPPPPVPPAWTRLNSHRQVWNWAFEWSTPLFLAFAHRAAAIRAHAAFAPPRPHMADAFSLDLWRCISEFLASDTLAQVCGPLYRRLGRRYVRFRLAACNVVPRLAALLPTICVLHGTCSNLGPRGSSKAGSLASLGAAPHLHTLSLTLNGGAVGPQGARALAMLRDSPRLRTLTLRLKDNEVSDAGAQALAALSDAPQLRSLALDLSSPNTPDARVGDPGAAALAQLRNATALQGLTLCLRRTRVGDTGAEALAGVGLAPQLRVLRVELGSTAVRSRGAQAYAALKAARLLHTLELDLRGCPVSDAGAEALAELREAPTLRTLTLHLSHAQIHHRGAQALALLRTTPRLQQLRLDLLCNDVGPEGAEALAELRCAPLLEQLCLELARNGVGDRGACALARLKDAPALRRLSLSLFCNAVSDAGAQALAALGAAPALEVLDLDLSRNSGVGDDAGRALVRLCDAPALHALHLWLAGTGIAGLAAVQESSIPLNLTIMFRDECTLSASFCRYCPKECAVPHCLTAALRVAVQGPGFYERWMPSAQTEGQVDGLGLELYGRTKYFHGLMLRLADCRLD